MNSSNIYHVHPYDIPSGDHALTADALISIPATIGGGFFGAIILGYAMKKVLKLIAVVVGLFIGGLGYL